MSIAYFSAFISALLYFKQFEDSNYRANLDTFIRRIIHLHSSRLSDDIIIAANRFFL
ncbi:hypothetical protein CRE_24619 [Caenorhabditis remanei]|uniref:Uncharacterized protein n=1 Tax=Caenorhabditis remanei TaxID=31234 RepID=E3MVG8_CAERE|nr:hypothetical protein CRE_24619 [Caenorhabditis remanei]